MSNNQNNKFDKIRPLLEHYYACPFIIPDYILNLIELLNYEKITVSEKNEFILSIINTVKESLITRINFYSLIISILNIKPEDSFSYFIKLDDDLMDDTEKFIENNLKFINLQFLIAYILCEYIGNFNFDDNYYSENYTNDKIKIFDEIKILYKKNISDIIIGCLNFYFSVKEKGFDEGVCYTNENNSYDDYKDGYKNGFDDALNDEVDSEIISDQEERN